MAYDQGLRSIGVPASADLSASQFCFMAVNASGQLALPAAGGDAAFDFDMFPRVCVRLIWHAADEEFPPSATLLLPANIDAFFCIEDIVVLSERLVARLGGRGF